MDTIVIQTKEEFQEILAQNSIFFLLKHSLTCPISAEAKKGFDEFSDGTDIPLYVLYVQKARKLSNDIADKYNVKHESPQALLFKDNQVIWHDSHNNITNEALTNQASSKVE